MTTSIIYFPAMREGAVHLERHQPNPPEAPAELPGLWTKAGHQKEAGGWGGGSCQPAALDVKEEEKKPNQWESCHPSALDPGNSALSFNQRLRDHKHHSRGPGNTGLLWGDGDQLLLTERREEQA